MLEYLQLYWVLKRYMEILQTSRNITSEKMVEFLRVEERVFGKILQVRGWVFRGVFLGNITSDVEKVLGSGESFLALRLIFFLVCVVQRELELYIEKERWVTWSTWETVGIRIWKWIVIILSAFYCCCLLVPTLCFVLLLSSGVDALLLSFCTDNSFFFSFFSFFLLCI